MDFGTHIYPGKKEIFECGYQTSSRRGIFKEVVTPSHLLELKPVVSQVS